MANQSLIVPSPGFGIGGSLLSQCDFAWSLGEASGDRIAAKGGVDLSPTGGVTTRNGLVGLAMDGTTAGVSAVNIAGLEITIGVSVTLWAYFDAASISTSDYLLHCTDSGTLAANERWSLYTDGGGNLIWSVSNGTSHVTVSQAIAAGSWYRIDAACDVGGDVISLALDGGTASTSSFTGTPGGGATPDLYVGLKSDDSAHFAGGLQQLYIGRGAFADERASILSKTTALWRLDESSAGVSSEPRVNAITPGTLDFPDDETIPSDAGPANVGLTADHGAAADGMEQTGGVKAAFKPAPDLSITALIKPVSATTQYWLHLGDTINGGDHYFLAYVATSNKVGWRVSDGVNKVTIVSDDTISAGAWNLIALEYFDAGPSFRVSINGGAWKSAAHVGFAEGASVLDRLTSGAHNTGVNNIDGMAQLRIAAGSGVELSDAELSWLYNSGNFQFI